jgi:hypothetical protein
MTPYVLRASSVAAAREFYYRTCCFEAAHFPFMIAMFILAVNQLLAGRADLAIEDLTINMVLNVYPIMHHRNTRARIVALLLKRRNRS